MGTVRFATRSGMTRQPNFWPMTSLAWSAPQDSAIGGRNCPSGNCEAFARSADADVAFNPVVVGRELCIADGPVFAVAVAGGGFEFVVAVAIAFARPAERLPADLPAANPHERLVRGKGVGVLQIVDEELMAVFVAGVTQPLHRLVLEQALLIAEAAELQLVGPDVLSEIARRDARRSSFEHEHGESTLGHLLGDPSATGAGTDDEHFIRHGVHKTDSGNRSEETLPPSVQAQHKHQIAGDGGEILVPGLRPIIAKSAGTPKGNDVRMGASRRGAVYSVDDRMRFTRPAAGRARVVRGRLARRAGRFPQLARS